MVRSLGLVSALVGGVCLLAPAGRLSPAWAAGESVPRTRDACIPFADRVIAFDTDADLYVVGTYTQRDVARTGMEPNLLELRRISTGAQIDLVNCALHADELGAAAARGPCDFRIEFARHVGAGRFRQHGERLDLQRFKVATVEEDGLRGQVLMVKAARSGWQRLAWLEQQIAEAAEKVTLRLVAAERRGGHVDLVLARRQRGGDCNNTTVRVLRLREVDLEQPAAAARQGHLLAHLSSSSPLVAWRTAAELAPLPPARLLIGMAVAEEAGMPQLAARWWQATTAQLPVEQVGPLAQALRDRPELAVTRALVKLPALPEATAAAPK